MCLVCSGFITEDWACAQSLMAKGGREKGQLGYQLALKFICTPALSVPCERVFSKAGDVLCKKEKEKKLLIIYKMPDYFSLSHNSTQTDQMSAQTLFLYFTFSLQKHFNNTDFPISHTFTQSNILPHSTFVTKYYNINLLPSFSNTLSTLYRPYYQIYSKHRTGAPCSQSFGCHTPFNHQVSLVFT